MFRAKQDIVNSISSRSSKKWVEETNSQVDKEWKLFKKLHVFSFQQDQRSKLFNNPTNICIRTVITLQLNSIGWVSKQFAVSEIRDAVLAHNGESPSKFKAADWQVYASSLWSLITLDGLITMKDVGIIIKLSCALERQHALAYQIISVSNKMPYLINFVLRTEKNLEGLINKA